METQSIGLNDYRAVLLIAFIIMMVGIIPYGLIDSSFSWACFVTAGAVFMVGLGMLLTSTGGNFNYNVAPKHSKPANRGKKSAKSAPRTAKKLVRKSTPKGRSRR